MDRFMVTDNEEENLRLKIVRLEERQNEIARRLDHLESPEMRNRIETELSELKRAHQSLRSDYDKMVSRSAGVFVAILSIGSLVGWVISQVKDFFGRGHT